MSNKYYRKNCMLSLESPKMAKIQLCRMP